MGANDHGLGEPWLRYRRSRRTRAIAARELGDCCEFSVSDDGPGIPRAFHDTVFQMFETLKRRDVVEGSGMGLALVKKIIETAGGRVWIEPSDGRGTTVRFTWPRRVPSYPGHPTPVVKATVPTEARR